MGKHGYALEFAKKLPLCEDFIATKKSDKTKESYRYSLGRWAMFLSSCEISLWTDDLPGKFYLHLDESGVGWSSLQSHLSAVMQYLYFLERQNALPFPASEAKKKLKRVKDTIGL